MKCLTDTGASALGFVDKVFVRKNKLVTIPLARPYRLKLADNKAAPNITHMAKVLFQLGKEYLDKLWCIITSLGSFDLILGIPWLKLHDPESKFSTRILNFNSDYYIIYCLSHCRLVTIYSGKSPPSKKSLLPNNIVEVSAYAFMKMAERSDNEVISIWPEHFEILDSADETVSVLTADVVAIIAEDYEKFFAKINKTPLTKEMLKERVPQEYY